MFDTQIGQLSSTDLDKFFEAVPAGTPGANDLENGTQPNQINGDDIPFLEDDASFEEPAAKTAEEIAAEKLVTDKAAADAAALAKANEGKTAEQIAADTAAAEALAAKAAEDAANQPDPAEVANVLKTTVEFLVKNGQWADFEGREDLEITEEVYAELAAKQDEFRVGKLFNELVDSTGNYGKAIIGHIKNGGNPDEIIDLFKEQKQVEAIDTTTESGKQAVIEKYYKEVAGLKPEKVDKTIKRLITDNEIEVEYNDIKDAYQKHFDKKLAEVQAETRAQEQLEADRKVAFVSNITSALNDDTTITPKEREEIAKSILDFKHNVGGGKKVNDFYVKFAEMQADPKQYIKLVRFVMNPLNYEKAIATKKESEIAKTTFNFIKGNATLQKIKSPTTEIKDTVTKTHRGTDFSFAQKR